MPRDSSGNYTLPAGNPVVAGTNITASWCNLTLPDIGTDITSSLDRSGRGGMLAALKGIDGVVGAPAFSWTQEPTSGLYRVSAGVIGVAIGGVSRGTFSAAGFTGSVVDPTKLSGTYTPTVSVVNNGTSTGGLVNQYLRLDNVVTVSGAINWTPTTAGTGATAAITLPFASNFAAPENCVGTGRTNISLDPVYAYADSANDRVNLIVPTCTTNSANIWYYQFTYRII